MDLPLVTILIPIYNVEKYLKECVMSVMTQTYSNLEILLVEDGSLDGTRGLAFDIAKIDSRIKVLDNSHNNGLSGMNALNLGIQHARGKYIARLDGDDLMLVDRVAKQVKFLEDNEDVVMVGSYMEVCDMEMKPLNTRAYPLADNEIRKVMFRFSPFCHGSVMYRTDIVRDARGYMVPVAEDYDLYFRLGLRGKLANIPEVLVKVRTRKDSTSQSKGRKQELATLFIRLKAVAEYGYQHTYFDVFYGILQFLSMFFIPSRVKFWIFNFIRKY